MNKKIIFLGTCLSIVMLITSKGLNAFDIENQSGKPIKNIVVNIYSYALARGSYLLGKTIPKKTIRVGDLNTQKEGKSLKYDWKQGETDQYPTYVKVNIKWTIDNKIYSTGKILAIDEKKSPPNVKSIVIKPPQADKCPYDVWRKGVLGIGVFGGTLYAKPVKK
ncbi:hypothetical protein ACFLYU_03350 [Candidatus Dependentiae bacterium]